MGGFGTFLQDNIVYVFLIITMVPLFFLSVYEYFNYKKTAAEKAVKSRLSDDSIEKRIAEYQEHFESIFAKKKKEVEEKLEKAEIKLTIKEYMFIMMVAMTAGAFIGFVITPFGFIFEWFFSWIGSTAIRVPVYKIAAGAVFAYLGYFVPNIWFNFLKSKKEKMMSEQVEDFLIALYENLIAGMNEPEALKNAGKDLPYPMGNEVMLAYEEYVSGKRFVDALESFKKRVDNSDLRMAITSMQIQHETGGELANLLKNLITIISDRQVLKKEVEKIVAESKFTAFFLMVTPIVLISFISTMNGELYSSMLEKPLGIIILLVGAIFYGVGVFFIINVLQMIRKITI